MKLKHKNGWGAEIIWNRYIPLCLCLGVSLMIVLSGCGPNASSPDEAEKAAERELREIAVGAATVLNVYMDARVTEMLVASKLDGSLREALIAPQAQANANRTLDEWLKISGAYEAILLLDKSGIAVASAPASLVSRDFSDDGVFKGAIKGKVTVSDVHKSDVLVSPVPTRKGKAEPTAVWTLAMGVPVAVENNERSVLLGFLDWSALARLTSGLVAGKTGYVYVLNKENRVIVHPSTHIYGTALRDPIINLPALDAAVNKKVDSYRYEFVNPIVGKTDIKIVGFAYPKGYGNFPEQGWTVAACADESEILGVHPFWRMLLR